jgi:hypothetical protein
MRKVIFCFLFLFCLSNVFGENLNVKDLKSKGFSLIEDHSFLVALEHWGKVKFLSCEQNPESTAKLAFFLSDAKGKIICSLPDFYGNHWTFYEMKAVSFKDINKDGIKDIIVIADCVTGVGNEGAVPFSVCAIYFQFEKGFKNVQKLDEAINHAVKNKTIEMIIKYTQDKVENINNLLKTSL